jgi:G:T-mismatch repair DNA endonuclease (very short patch repair protein)
MLYYNIKRKKTKRKLGWKILVIWECQIRRRRTSQNPEKIIDKISNFLKR